MKKDLFNLSEEKFLVKNARQYVVAPSLPDNLIPLLDIARNLWWVWNSGAMELFRRMDGRFSILLCLANTKVLRQIITLPLAAEENLQQTLRFEIDRYTPFRADQVYFDYRIKARD
jgi:hypothetical protein